MLRGSRSLVQVFFPTGSEYIYEDQLEPIDSLDHPLDLFQEKKLAGVKDLRRALTFERLTGRLVDLIYSMEITNTDFYAYQFKPVIKILESATKGILIADEVGLGKTIEAGLIWTELMSRFDDFRKLMVLCPAMLRDKWQLELQRRFGIKADIVNSREALKVLKNAKSDGPNASFSIICSMQGLRPRRKAENDVSSDNLIAFLDENQYDEALIDCLIIDEAHYLRNPETKTARLGKHLRAVSEYLVLLSATPIHLHNADLYYLLNLLDEDRFSVLSSFSDILDANRPLIKLKNRLLDISSLTQREFNQLVKSAKSHRLLNDSRQLAAYIKSPPTQDALDDPKQRAELAHHFDSINILGNVVNRTRKRDVLRRVRREASAIKISLSEPEAMFYTKVTDLVREFCSQRLYFESFFLVSPQRQMCSSMPAALRDWLRRGEQFDVASIYEDLGLYEEEKIGPLTKELITNASQLGNYQELYENDSKYIGLQQQLVELFRHRPDDKIVIFSFYKATIHYLFERLQDTGIQSIILEGDPKLDKTEIVRQFESSEKLRVLLSTEVGSEGIDLQFCSTLINYDLPWNPMKVEQRIGRIDRIGQEAEKINIINLFYEDTIDARIYDRLLVRLNIFEEALGGLEAVIGKEIRELTIELLSKRLTPEEQDEQISQRTQAIENTLVEEKRLESEASSLVAYGDYILNKINAAKELNRWINGKELFNYVADFITLHYPGSDIKLLNDEEVICTITLSSNARLDLELYLRSKKLLSTTKLISLNQTSIKYKFLNKLFAVDKKHEIINQVHPLIRFINDEMPKKKHFFHPAVNLQLSRSKLSDKFNPGIYVFSIQKWSFQGVQDIEKLFYSAALMVSAPILLSPEESEILISTVAMAGQDWYEARSIQDWPALYDILNSYCFERAEAEFQKESNRIRNKNDDMADVQLRTLELHHENQKNKLLKEIQHLREAGNDFQVRMREPRIAKLKEKIDVQKASIHKKKSLVMPQPKDICVGVIKVD